MKNTSPAIFACSISKFVEKDKNAKKKENFTNMQNKQQQKRNNFIKTCEKNRECIL